MVKLMNEEIAKVFITHLGCSARFRIEQELPVELIGIENECAYVMQHSYGRRNVHISFLQLLLTPLSAISDEDAIEVAKMWKGTLPDDIDKNGLIQYGKSVTSIWKDTLPSPIFQFLLSKHYDVPFFFSPGHPENGKTAIELGIAVDKTKII